MSFETLMASQTVLSVYEKVLTERAEYMETTRQQSETTSRLMANLAAAR